MKWSLNWDLTYEPTKKHQKIKKQDLQSIIFVLDGINEADMYHWKNCILPNLTSTCLRCSSKSECTPKEFYKYDMVVHLKGRMRKWKICSYYISLFHLSNSSFTWSDNSNLMSQTNSYRDAQSICKSKNFIPSAKWIICSPHFKEKIFNRWRKQRQFLQKTKKKCKKDRQGKSSISHTCTHVCNNANSICHSQR